MCESKLNRVFSNLLRADYKITDDTMLEKLLTHLGDNTEEDSLLLALPACRQWVKAVLTQWSEGKIHCAVVGFALRLFGLIMKDETHFKSFVINEAEASFMKSLVSMLGQSGDGVKNFTVKCAYLKMIKSFACHSIGRQWILETNVWQIVLSWRADKSMFVVREARAVMVMLMNSVGTDGCSYHEQILSEVLSPLMHIPTSGTKDLCPNPKLNTVFDDTNLLPTLHILCEILVGSLETIDMDTGIVMSPVAKVLNLPKFNFEEKLLQLVEICDKDILLEALSKSMILFYIATYSSDVNKNNWPDEIIARFQPLCDDIMSLQNILIKKGKLRIVMKTCELCLAQWHVVTTFCSKSDKSKQNDGSEFPLRSSGTFEAQQLCLHVCPLFVGWKTPENNALDLFVSELCNISSQHFLRLINDYRDVVANVSIPDSLPVSCLNGLMSISSSLSKVNAVLLFRTFIYILKCYAGSSGDEENRAWTSGKLFSLGGTPKVAATPSYISVLLDCLSKIMVRFQITGRDCAEAICLLNLSLDVLTTNKLVRTVAVKVEALKLVKLCIETSFPPDPTLPKNTFLSNVVSQLGPTVMRLMNDPSWEVRDSTLELVLVITTMAKSEYPAFQDIIEDHKLCDMIVDFALNDSESYVCASGIKCVSAAILIDRFWDGNLEKKAMPARMIDFVNGDGGDTVRTEATNFILQVYEHRTIEPDVLDNVFTLMNKVIMSDFHWEVKMNAIRFWKLVIKKQLADKGIYPDGISYVDQVEVTPETMQLRLKSSLDFLSKTGCLQVLFEALLEENDLHVMTEAAEVISYVADILRKHDLLPCSQTEEAPANHQNQTTSVEQSSNESVTHLTNSSKDHPASHNDLKERNPTDSDESKKRNQDEIIDAILKDKDISLLAEVYKGFGADPPMNEIDENLKKRMVDPMKPAEFLEKLGRVNVNAYVEGHKKWVEESSNNIESLLNDMLIHVLEDEEFNIADCY